MRGGEELWNCCNFQQVDTLPQEEMGGNPNSGKQDKEASKGAYPYPDKVRAERIARKQARARQKPKRRITQLRKETRLWFLLQLDTIVIYWGNLKRYILTAVDHASKLGYARMYKNRSSKAASDFLYRLRYLINQPIENIQTDNGSEFAYYFERAASSLNIARYFSRVRTPRDNPEIERFHQTLEYEWLAEYNFNRPHEAFDYLTPIGYIERELSRIRGSPQVLPMWSASTRCCLLTD